MRKFTPVAVLQVSLLAVGGSAVTVKAADTYQAVTYKEAYQAAEETGKPLVVLIGADWCPACQSMKRSVMPQVAAAGSLKNVAFATLNTDRESATAEPMMEGNLIPQLVMYSKTHDGWKRQRLIGGQSVSAVEEFLASATKQQPAVETVGKRN